MWHSGSHSSILPPQAFLASLYPLSMLLQQYVLIAPNNNPMLTPNTGFLTPYTSFQGKPVQALGKITEPLVSSTRNPTGSRVLDVESEKGHNYQSSS
jgi:hypothetical protein